MLVREPDVNAKPDPGVDHFVCRFFFADVTEHRGLEQDAGQVLTFGRTTAA